MVTITDRHQKGKNLINQALKILAIINQVDLPIIYKDIGEYLHYPNWETFRYYLKPKSKKQFNPYELSFIANLLIFSFCKFITRWCEDTSKSYGYNFSHFSQHVLDFISGFDVSNFPITLSSQNALNSSKLMLDISQFIRDKVEIIESKFSIFEESLKNQSNNIVDNSFQIHNDDNNALLEELIYRIENNLPTSDLCITIGNRTIRRAIPLLSQIIDGPIVEDHFYAIHALTKIGGDQATQVIIDSIYKWFARGYSENFDRSLRFWGLARIGTQKALEYVLDIASNPKMETLISTPRMIIIFFQDINNKSALPFLINALQNNDPEIRYYSTVALGNIKSDLAIPYIINLLFDKVSYVRYIAIKIIYYDYEYIQDPDAIKAIIQLLFHPEGRIRRAGLLGLSKIARLLINKDTIELVHQIIERDPDRDVVKEAISTLLVIDHKGTFPYLWDLYLNQYSEKETISELLCDIRFLDDMRNNLPQTKNLIDKLTTTIGIHLTPRGLISLPDGQIMTMKNVIKTMDKPKELNGF
jgi:hypothetical protein